MDGRFVFVACAAFASAKKVLLIHSGHEGSHAICQSFGRLCFAVDCTERLDFQGAPFNWTKIKESEAEVLLVRPPPHGDIPVDDIMLIIVRTDLMRWALSLYFKRNEDKLAANMTSKDVGKRADPQFFPNETVHPDYFDIRILKRTADELVDFWRRKVEILDRLVRRTYAIVTYEQFLMGGLDYLREVANFVGVRNASSCEDNPVLFDIPHKVHSDDIRDVATNSMDVLRHFLTTPYPTWPQILDGRHIDHHP